MDGYHTDSADGTRGSAKEDMKDAGKNLGNAAKDAAKGAGNAVKDAAKGAGDAAKDVGEAAKDAARGVGDARRTPWMAGPRRPRTPQKAPKTASK